VPSLRAISLEAACTHLISQLHNRSKPSAALQAAPGALLSDLLAEILLRRPDLEAEERLAALRLVLQSDVAVLATGPFPATLHVAVLDVIRKRGAGLRRLDLRGVWSRVGGAVSAAALVAMVAGLPKLQVLSAPHSCTDALLVALAAHCDQLRVLDASGEGFIGSTGVEALASSPCAASLQKVDLGCRGEVRVPPSVVAELLVRAPRLTSLGSYAYTGSAAATLPPDHPPLLLTYLRDTGTAVRTADLLVRLCPRLRFVYLDTPEVGVLPMLAQLPALRSLKVRAFRLAELLALLEKAGSRILSLEFVGSSDEPLPLDVLATLCPNLERLESGSVALVPYIPPSTRFPALRSFGVGRSVLSTSVVRNVVKSAPSLQRLAVATALLDLGDGDIAALAGPELVELWLMAAPRLSQDAVLTLMSSAPQLRIIGDLAGWDVDAAEVVQMRLLLAECNLDLSLWSSGDLDDVTGQDAILDEDFTDDSDFEPIG